MIRKFLIAGKHVYFATTPPEAHMESARSVEVEMPIEVYWEAREHLKSSEYLQASGETPADISAEIKKVYQLCSRYAVQEKDRTWLQERTNAI